MTFGADCIEKGGKNGNFKHSNVKRGGSSKKASAGPSDHTMGFSRGALSDEETAALLSAVEGESFLLEYPDAKAGSRITGKFYINSRTAPLYCYTYGGREKGDGWRWQGLSLTFTEV